MYLNSFLRIGDTWFVYAIILHAHASLIRLWHYYTCKVPCKSTSPSYKCINQYSQLQPCNHPPDDVIKLTHFPRYWPFVRGIHRSPVNSPHKGQWRGALIFSVICARINGWVNNGKAGDLRRRRAHNDVIVMFINSPHTSDVIESVVQDELQGSVLRKETCFVVTLIWTFPVGSAVFFT